MNSALHATYHEKHSGKSDFISMGKRERNGSFHVANGQGAEVVFCQLVADFVAFANFVECCTSGSTLNSSSSFYNRLSPAP